MTPISIAIRFKKFNKIKLAAQSLASYPPTFPEHSFEVLIDLSSHKKLFPLLQQIFSLFANDLRLEPGWAKRLGSNIRKLDDNTTQLPLTYVEAFGLLVVLLKIATNLLADGPHDPQQRDGLCEIAGYEAFGTDMLATDIGVFADELLKAIDYRRISDLCIEIDGLMDM